MKANFILISILIFVKTADPTPEQLEQIRADILKYHNEYRKIHQVDELTRDADIEKIAQNYSEYLIKNNIFDHSHRKGYGENLYGCTGSGICATGKSVTDNWYNEIQFYDYNNPVFSGETGHFTQVVWKGSTKIGCGVACN